MLVDIDKRENGTQFLRRRLAIAVLVSAIAAYSPAQTATPQQRDAGGVHAPTKQLERGRTVYVLSSCHFCHGVDLSSASMGAADLMHSTLVGSDTGGNLIGPIVRAGLPNLQTSMPSYADMTPAQISDLAAYVHYLRQQGKYKELLAAKLPLGDAAAGKKYYNDKGGCIACHTTASLKSLIKQVSPSALESQLLMPEIAKPKEGVLPGPAAEAHMRLTENMTPVILADLLSYLSAL